MRGFPSAIDPLDLRHEDRYDLILIVSLFSHLPIAAWGPWLERLGRLLEPGGALAFSTLGMHAFAVNVTEEERGAFDEVAEGFFYRAANETRGRLDTDHYGLSYVAEDPVRELAGQHFPGRVVAACPRALNDFQDVYVLERTRRPALGSAPMRIEGAGALVAGGASGLGAATARRLAAAGARVTIADLNADKGEALAAELGAAFARCDVTDAAQVQAAVEAARRAADLRLLRRGRLGGEDRRPPRPAQPRAVPDRHRREPDRHVQRAAARRRGDARQRARRRGRARRVHQHRLDRRFDGQIGQLAYSASKGGIVGMTLPAARDLASSGIRVVTIAPGLFDTPLLAGLPEEARIALGEQVPHPHRLGHPDEYGDLAARIVENPMLNGEVIRLDGALRMPPR